MLSLYAVVEIYCNFIVVVKATVFLKADVIVGLTEEVKAGVPVSG